MIRLDSFGIFIQTDLTCYNKTNFPLIRQVEFRTKMKLSHQLNECKLKSLKKIAIWQSRAVTSHNTITFRDIWVNCLAAFHQVLLFTLFFLKHNLPFSLIPSDPLKQNSTREVLFTWGRHKYWLLLYSSFSHLRSFDAWVVSFSFFGHSFTNLVPINIMSYSISIITCTFISNFTQAIVILLLFCVSFLIR